MTSRRATERGILAPALGLVFVLSACAAQVTPGPTSTPVLPTASPTPTQAPMPDPSGLIEHPTGSDDVVLRFDEGGGIFGGIGFFPTHLPVLSLYGDGTAVYAPAMDLIERPGPLPLRMATMDEAQMSALLGFALGQGGLAEAEPFYPSDGCADCPTTVFAIHAGGVDKTVGVYALGMEQPDSPDREIRARFAQLAALLRDFGAQVAVGHAADAGTYEPPAYRAILAEAQGTPGSVRDWPWVDLAPADFVRQPGDPTFAARTVLTPEQARRLADAPEGGVYSVAVEAPDGVVYTIALRPLLPDETV